MSQADCVFCKIVAGQIPSAQVYEDDACLAFLDIGPLADGHLLIVPRKHYDGFPTCPRPTLPLSPASCRNWSRLSSRSPAPPAATSCRTTAGSAAKLVPHVHFHIIPRREGDGLGYRWNATKYPEGKAQQVQQALLQALKS